MVFLAITTSGLREAIEIAERRELSIRCGADAISESEYEALEGPAISRFVYSLANEGPAVLAGAIGTSRSITQAKPCGWSMYRVSPNPSIEGTSTSGLRPLAAAPHVKR